MDEDYDYEVHPDELEDDFDPYDLLIKAIDTNDTKFFRSNFF